MRNRIWFFTSLIPWIVSRRASRIRPKRLILGLSLIAALLSWGCPKQDPLQAFNPPQSTPNDPPPAPVPEPVTALLFGAALLIGGGILRRLRNGSNH